MSSLSKLIPGCLHKYYFELYISRSSWDLSVPKFKWTRTLKLIKEYKVYFSHKEKLLGSIARYKDWIHMLRLYFLGLLTHRHSPNIPVELLLCHSDIDTWICNAIWEGMGYQVWPPVALVYKFVKTLLTHIVNSCWPSRIMLSTFLLKLYFNFRT